MSALDQIHRQAQSNLRDGVSTSVARMLAQISLDRTPEVRDAYAAATARIINAGQWQAAQLAQTYIGVLAPPVRDVDLEGALINAGRVVTEDDGRAVGGLLRMWHLLDEGVDEADARAEAGTFAGDMAATTLQGASRDALDEATAAAAREPRWRLEPNPGACEWCQFIADTGARYLSAESVPIPHSPGGEHPGGVCQCGPAPDFEPEYEPDEFEVWADESGIPIDNVPLRDLRTLESLHATYGDRLVVHDWDSTVGIAVRDLGRMPDELHDQMAAFFRGNLDRYPDAGIYLGRGHVPDLDHLEHLADKHPRGWPEGSTWKEVAGAYSPNKRVVAIGTGPTGSASVGLHEFGHAVDDMHRRSLGTVASVTGEFSDAYDRAVAASYDRGFWISPYYLQPGADGKSEMFAEAFARYNLNVPGYKTNFAYLQELVGTRDGANALIAFFDDLLT